MPSEKDSSQASLSQEEFRELAMRYLEGEDSQELDQDVGDLLKNKAFRASLFEYAIETAVLYNSFLVSGASSGGSLSDRHEPVLLPARSALASHRHALSLLAACACVAAFFGAWRLSEELSRPKLSEPTSPIVLCSIEVASGEVLLSGKPAHTGQVLTDGQSLRTSGPVSSANLLLSNGASIHLSGDAYASFQQTRGLNEIFVDYGSMAVRAPRLPTGKPIHLHTPAAFLEINDAHFAVDVDNEVTGLAVDNGSVRMSPRGSKRTVEIASSQAAEVRHSDITPLSGFNVPVEWSQDFDTGLPAAWQHGVLVRSVHSDSAGAVTQSPPQTTFRHGPQGKREISEECLIMSESSWVQGLTSVKESTVFTYRVKMDKPQWYHAFLTIRTTGEGNGDFGGVFEYQEVDTRWQDVKPGEWREITVPLSDFRRTEEIGGYAGRKYGYHYNQGAAAPPIGGLITSVIFRSESEDRALTVDDLRIASPSDASLSSSN